MDEEPPPPLLPPKRHTKFNIEPNKDIFSMPIMDIEHSNDGQPPVIPPKRSAVSNDEINRRLGITSPKPSSKSSEFSYSNNSTNLENTSALLATSVPPCKTSSSPPSHSYLNAADMKNHEEEEKPLQRDEPVNSNCVDGKELLHSNNEKSPPHNTKSDLEQKVEEKRCNNHSELIEPNHHVEQEHNDSGKSNGTISTSDSSMQPLTLDTSSSAILQRRTDSPAGRNPTLSTFTSVSTPGKTKNSDFLTRASVFEAQQSSGNKTSTTRVDYVLASGHISDLAKNLKENLKVRLPLENTNARDSKKIDKRIMELPLGSPSSPKKLHAKPGLISGISPSEYSGSDEEKRSPNYSSLGKNKKEDRRETKNNYNDEIGESDDGLSDGGEFFDTDFEFSRPSEDILLKSVPIVPAQKSRLTEKIGWLYKYSSSQPGTMGKFGSQWQKRWVVLDGKSMLKYFTNNKSFVSKRVIPVCTMMMVDQEIKQSGEAHQYRFKLTTVDRVYRFATDTADNLTLWTSILMHAIIITKSMVSNLSKYEEKFRNGGDMNNPEKEGYAKMEGSRNRRYLAIKRGKFCFYNTQNDFSAYSPIHLVELQLANVKDIGKLKLQLTTPQVIFVFIFESQEELNGWKSAFETGISYALGDDKIMDEVYENEYNRFCADCGASNPEWAAINYGITICQNCAGVHRNFNNARVRSLRMDSKVWTTVLMQLMKTIGNKKSNRFWEHRLVEGEKPDAEDAGSIRKEFIENKYMKHKYSNKAMYDHLNPIELNERLWKAVQSHEVVETLQLVFSGADPCYRPGVKEDGPSAYELAERTGQLLQMEFLRLNGANIPSGQ